MECPSAVRLAGAASCTRAALLFELRVDARTAARGACEGGRFLGAEGQRRGNRAGGRGECLCERSGAHAGEACPSAEPSLAAGADWRGGRGASRGSARANRKEERKRLRSGLRGFG